jgi:hypothetical protein
MSPFRFKLKVPLIHFVKSMYLDITDDQVRNDKNMYARSLLYRRRRAKTIPPLRTAVDVAGEHLAALTAQKGIPIPRLSAARRSRPQSAQRPFFAIPRPDRCARARALRRSSALRSTSWRPLFHLDTESPRNGSLTSSLLPVTDHRRGALPEHNLPIMAITTEDAASCFVFFCF